MPQNSMPADWEPPAPAWQSKWHDESDELVAAYFGIQAEQPTLLEAWASHVFSENMHLRCLSKESTSTSKV